MSGGHVGDGRTAEQRQPSGLVGYGGKIGEQGSEVRDPASDSGARSISCLKVRGDREGVLHPGVTAPPGHEM